jgi:aspartate racemase
MTAKDDMPMMKNELVTTKGLRRAASGARHKTIGILGGMGPEATAYFFDLIIRNTAAGRDREHVPVILRSDPRVPDRTDAVLDKGESPVPMLRAGMKALRRAGADIMVMPCITAHYFLKDIAAARSNVPFVDLLDEARKYIRASIPGVRKIGLIATTGTVSSGTVREAFAGSGIEVTVPGSDEQEKVMEAVYGKRGIKAGFTTGRSRRLILGVAKGLVRNGAEAIMAGCTEVPLVLRQEDLAVPFIEPMRIAARVCIKKAGYQIRPDSDPLCWLKY